MKELSQNLGSAFGRLITEAMIPIIRRILFIMDEQGLITMPLKVDGQQVKVVPVSPLAQAQNMDEVNDVLQFMQVVATMGPEAQIALKKDNIIDFIAQRLGVPASLLTTQEERQMVMMQMAQAAEQAAMAQQAMAAPPDANAQMQMGNQAALAGPMQ